MISAELLAAGRPFVLIRQSADTNPGAWAQLQLVLARGVIGGSRGTLEVRTDVFLAELAALSRVRSLYQEELDFGQALTGQLKILAADRRERERAIEGRGEEKDNSQDDLESQLVDAGFVRQLKDFQLENLSRLLQLPHGADFSVPGAGKTTVALASFAVNRHRGRVAQLLVVGPIASFQAWKEDASACFDRQPVVVVHSGIESLIPDDTEILLTNYNRLSSDFDRIAAYVALRPTQVILDEAHRIKKGQGGVHGRAVLDLAYSARRRDVLTGTPAPQGSYDLVALMQFLYPGQDQQILPAGAYVERDGREEDVLQATSSAISRFFVRTPKSRLGLGETAFEVLSEPMKPIQRAIYDALLGRYRGSFQLEAGARRNMDRLGRLVMYLLEAATNPMLLVAGSDAADERGFAHPPLELLGDESLVDLLARYRDYETPWKYDRIAEIVAEAATRGEKVVVWSTFVRNLRALAAMLVEYSPAVVHGGVPPRDGAPPDSTTREGELDHFRFDPHCAVLLANPAACGEGVSLHHWCHHAVYLDRTFNAGHYLQSQDRIHRLGLDPRVTTRFTIILSDGTIDQSVDDRLREKIVALARLMDDPGLVHVSLPESDEPSYDGPAFADDYAAVRSHILGGAEANAS